MYEYEVQNSEILNAAKQLEKTKDEKQVESVTKLNYFKEEVARLHILLNRLRENEKAHEKIRDQSISIHGHIIEEGYKSQIASQTKLYHKKKEDLKTELHELKDKLKSLQVVEISLVAVKKENERI